MNKAEKLRIERRRRACWLAKRTRHDARQPKLRDELAAAKREIRRLRRERNHWCDVAAEAVADMILAKEDSDDSPIHLATAHRPYHRGN